MGDVVRGVEVGLDRGADDGAMRRAGALEAVAIGWVRLESLLGRYVGGDDEESGPVSRVPGGDEEDRSGLSAAGSPGKGRGLQISLRYEKAECAALLLPPVKSQTGGLRAQPEPAATSLFNLGSGLHEENDPDFLHLPLLLLRMPAPLKTVIVDFLSRTFDCRISSLSLGTRSMVRALERWIGDSGAPTKGQFAKDVVLTLGFYGPTVTQSQRQQKEVAGRDQVTGLVEDPGRTQDTLVGIKTIDVIIPYADLRRFLRAGRAYEAKQHDASAQTQDKQKQRPGAKDQHDDGPNKRRRLGGDKDEEGWTWRQWPSTSEQERETVRPQPFTEALAQYVRKHLALDMFHPAIRITKVACGGFALSEGRVKVFGVPPTSEGDGGLSDTKQRAVWGVLEGLLERAQLKFLDQRPGQATP